MTRVAVIGAGPSGLSQLRAFQSAAQKGAEVPEIVCYEKQENWGGLWNYTWRTGLDEYGEPVHGSMYRNLWINGPKEFFEMPDYTFEEHFSRHRQLASFLPRAVFFDYIEGRAKKADVRKWIRFRTVVRHVTYDEVKGLFSVTAHDVINDDEYTEEFDHVIVATGHFSTPNSPYFEGIETFNGRLLHAHDLRDVLEFKDKDVLLVGSSLSAEDIAVQCWKFGCKSVIISYHTKTMGLQWPNNIKEVPLLQKVEKNTCTFQDGSSADVDAIILCTGYLHHFPFMASEMRLRTTNRLASANLYKGVVWVDNPKLFYLGMQKQWYSFVLFDAQAWYVRDIIMRLIDVPDRDVRIADVEDRIVREDASDDNNDLVRYQGNYVKELIDDTDYPSFDVDATNQIVFEVMKQKESDITAYRNNCFKSVMTGVMASMHHTPWKDNFEDSMDSYLRN